MLTDEQLTAAILTALPIDHDDHTTVCRIHSQPGREPNVIWGRPEWVAHEILTAIRAAEQAA